MLKADPYSGPARYVGYDVITNFHFIMPRLRKQEEVDRRITWNLARNFIFVALF